MKNTYSSIDSATGSHDGGLVSIKVAAIEWLSTKWQRDFATGTVLPPSLLSGYEWIVIDLTQESYSYEETPQVSKAGGFFETVIAGLNNNLTPSVLLVLETLVNHQFVVIAKGCDGLERVCGNTDGGMRLTIGNTNKNETSGAKVLSLSLQYQHKKPNPFVVSPCTGITNFSSLSWNAQEINGDSFPYMIFAGGSAIGSAQVELIIDSSTSYQATVPEGESQLMLSECPGWPDLVYGNTYTMRWRRVCPHGFYTSWQQASVVYSW